MKTYKALILILDGLGDRPCPELGGKTPLEAARTPNLDRLAAAGQSGLMDPFIPGMPVDTHTGVSILFGLNPREAAHLNRGPIEAAGIGLELRPGDVFLRANLATLKKTKKRYKIIDRRAGRIREGAEALCAALQDVDLGGRIHGSLYPATQHRAVLRLSGPALSAAISDTDPGSRRIELGALPALPLKAADPMAQRTADAMNRFFIEAHRQLHRHEVNRKRRKRDLPPANGILTRCAGTYQPLTNLVSHYGLRTAVVAGERTVLGLARLFSFSALSDERFTSLPDTDLEAKVETAEKALQDHDLVFLHIKGTDITAHDHQPEEKQAFIERIDRGIGNLDREDLVIGVCADHSTACRTGEHTGDPVPILLHSPDGRVDQVQQFGENACSAGLLGRINGRAYLTTLLDAMGRLQNYRTIDADILAPF
ncbi:MAG: 2,3-bisphosphoglycerate-independent phosphoglycerate mutase [Pseudomonadota bacterium]|nr:2,3-bisphosphoglycerate-independent phosphoglycerate mutase [Pseudomonadota bacterium]